LASLIDRSAGRKIEKDMKEKDKKNQINVDSLSRKENAFVRHNLSDVAEKQEIQAEIDSKILEIYKDKAGKKVDVDKMKIRRRGSAVWRFFWRLLLLVLSLGAIYYLYLFFFAYDKNASSLEFSLEAPNKVLAGESFSYRIKAHNPTSYRLSAPRLELRYPASFVFDSASISPDSGNYGWNLNDIQSGGDFILEIKGYLLATEDSANVVFADLRYTPENYTSEMKKEASSSTIISGLGFRVDLDYPQTAFLKQDNYLYLLLYNIEDTYLNDFDLVFSLPPETDISLGDMPSIATSSVASTASSTAFSTSTPAVFSVTPAGGTVWRVSGLSKGMERQEIPLSYRVKQKLANPSIKVSLEKRLDNGNRLSFWEKEIKPELVSSDLSLSLTLNGSSASSAANPGDVLEYSLKYSNRGSNTYKDVSLMAVLDSSLLDWSTLADKNSGVIQGQAIIWNKEQIPALAEVKPNDEGNLDFSIKLKKAGDNAFSSSSSISAYGQYSLSLKEASLPKENSDNQSNKILTMINSDLSLEEKIIYFDSSNQVVGSGPLPFRVGEKTTVRVYWTVKNSQHDLSGVKILFPLNSQVSFDGSALSNAGSIYYDDSSRQVVWEIGRLPQSAYRTDAEFALGITPTVDDLGKLLILSSGSMLRATDEETKAVISKKLNPRTSKLEDDNAASLINDGLVTSY
jgi:uncharacterized repeat protein (TIGR01451 family)